MQTQLLLDQRFYIAAYGSLRKGCYNYTAFLNYFGTANFRYVEELRIKGFQLFSLGAYPAIKIGTLKDELTIDILQVSKMAYTRLVDMEENANYETLSLAIKDYPDVSIFVYKGEVNSLSYIKSGDWKEHQDTIETNTKNILERITG